MDTLHFDRLVRRMPGTARRGGLVSIPVLAFDLWRSGHGLLDVEARCRPRGDKKAINKKGYNACVDGEIRVVGAVEYCRLKKQGLLSGDCPAPVAPAA